MKFAKTARDSTGHLLEAGDIINVILNCEEAATVVVRKVVQRSRDQFPTIHGTKVVRDWKGVVLKTEQVQLDVNTYKQSNVVNPNALRDGVPFNNKLKELRTTILGK